MEATVSYLLMLQKCINSKQKIQKKKSYPLCLANASKDFTVDDNMKKTGLKGYIHVFSVDYIIIYTNDILILR